MLTTEQARQAWGPPCQGNRTAVAMFGAGTVTVRTPILPAVDALNRCLRAHNYRTRKADTGAYNCRRVTGGTGYSLHAYGIALDINWETNPYGPVLHTDMPPSMIAAIKAIRTKGGAQVWRWGGDYSGNKDAMHFEIVCTPADLARGIDATTVPAGTATTTPTTPASPTASEEDDMRIIVPQGDGVPADEKDRNHIVGGPNGIVQIRPDAPGETAGARTLANFQDKLGLHQEFVIDLTWDHIKAGYGPILNKPTPAGTGAKA